MSRILLVTSLLFSLALNACLQSNTKQPQVKVQHEPGFFVDAKGDTIQMVIKSEEQWKAQLEPLAFEVLRQKGTERAFTGEYADYHESGIYSCHACGLTLFSSETKFESGTGWPSFYAPLDKTHVLEETDSSYGMRRVEVMCRRCNGHLGHVFDDGPAPTGLRYCMNSISLSFQPQ